MRYLRKILLRSIMPMFAEADIATPNGEQIHLETHGPGRAAHKGDGRGIWQLREHGNNETPGASVSYKLQDLHHIAVATEDHPTASIDQFGSGYLRYRR